MARPAISPATTVPSCVLPVPGGLTRRTLLLDARAAGLEVVGEVEHAVDAAVNDVPDSPVQLEQLTRRLRRHPALERQAR